jgi:hypothetical protein
VTAVLDRLTTGEPQADGPSPRAAARRLAAQPRLAMPGPDSPLVSCVLATGDDLDAAARAAVCFDGQDYPARELVVVLPAAVGRLPGQVRALAAKILVAAPGTTPAQARDLGCRAASGAMLALWEGDAWYAPWRLRYQVCALLASRLPLSAGASVVRWDPGAGETWAGDADPGSTPLRVFGATVCLPRRAWEALPFAARSGMVHDDGTFLADAAPGPVHVPRGVHPCVVVRRGSFAPEWRRTCYPRGTAEVLLGEAAPGWGVGPRPEPLTQPVAGPVTPARPAPPLAGAGTLAPLHALRGADLPLVSCITPTFNRRRFIAQSTRYLARQDYPNLELVVVDDGSEHVVDLLDGMPGVRYVRLGERATIGHKRNVACQVARGEIVLQWDDDDWYGPHRVTRQVAQIVQGNVDVTGIGVNLLLDVASLWLWSTREHEAAEPEFASVESVAGGTLAYAKDWWRAVGGYPDASLGEDVALLQRFVDAGARVAAVSNQGAYVYVRHGRNSWRFDYTAQDGPEGWHPARTGPIPAQDLAFYASLTARSTADADAR